MLTAAAVGLMALAIALAVARAGALYEALARGWRKGGRAALISIASECGTAFGNALWRPAPGPEPGALARSVWLAVEGNISAGKSTLIRSLEDATGGWKSGSILEGFDVYYIKEDVGAWALFSDYYEDPRRWCFAFQMGVLLHRAEQVREVKEAILRSGRPAVVVSERSLDSCYRVFTEMCHARGLMDGRELEIYERAYKDCLRQGYGHIDKYIYCDTPPRLCYERYLRRNREGERLGLEYLELCAQKHAEWLNKPFMRVVRADTAEEHRECSGARWLELFRASARGGMPMERFKLEEAEKESVGRRDLRLGLCGHLRQGKSTLAGMLVRRQGFRELSFAEALRDIAAAITPLSRGDYEGAAKDSPHAALQGRSPREFLCALGKALRGLGDFYGKGSGPLICALLKKLDGAGARVVVSDCRMPAEMEALKAAGFRIAKVHGRPGAPTPSMTEETESQLWSMKEDLDVRNDGEPAEMYKALLEGLGY